ncbi:anti-sigma factor family protein [Paraburkholderia phenoliruptrix]|uniref:anti-sigma factor family protein n=1 Tax=Paraburkholderia phenoliruptrix TaxID=252970 RepID=UPI001C6E86F1|nr:anti-sigma factor [Paraburkholderia phenoliruptrix]MBW9102628.1 anti-sigma factor [Paraburkholderia phenoliruptrix]MBW9128911.1 anti-sigma factor [Paraburkholderia ginsengiterrae]
MKPDDSQLIAYADGELSAREAEPVERALAQSADLRESVALLQASRLPYREAFAAQKLPPLPDDLRRRIESMAQAAGRQASSDFAPQEQRSARRVWLAAAFVAGAFCAGLVQQLGAWPGAWGERAVSTAAVQPRPWISVAVDYQRMYTRETVAHVVPDGAASTRTVDAIRKVDGIRLRMPDLQAAGLSFKTVERLRYNGKPLVQMVYLPEHGMPVALCVMKDSRPDESIAQREMDGMKVVSWRQNELSYALIGKPDSADLPAIARQISNGNVDDMFSALDVRRPAVG